jgi:hypothetical protein
MIQTKKKGNTDIIFISWFDTAKLLDERIAENGLWSWQVDKVSQSGDRLYIVGTLTIESFDDNLSVSYSATGTELLACSSYGDPSSNAEAMAFKRAAAKAGLGRGFYYKEIREEIKKELKTTSTKTKQANNNYSVKTQSKPQTTKVKPYSDYIFPSGNHQGKTMLQVFNCDRQYLTKLLSAENCSIKDKILAFLNG